LKRVQKDGPRFFTGSTVKNSTGGVTNNLQMYLKGILQSMLRASVGHCFGYP